MSNAELKKPISLGEAEVLLRQYHPEYAFTENQLRQMCLQQSIPFLPVPRGGRVRKVSYFVRVADLVACWKKLEVTV